MEDSAVNVPALITAHVDLAAKKATKAAYGYDIITQVLYPNEGTEDAPAIVAANSRYELPNPFPGYFVRCEAQLLIDGRWGNPFWNMGAASNTWGTRATQILPDDIIVVRTGSGGSYLLSVRSGGAHATANSASDAPCRVVITRLGPYTPVAFRRAMEDTNE